MFASSIRSPTHPDRAALGRCPQAYAPRPSVVAAAMSDDPCFRSVGGSAWPAPIARRWFGDDPAFRGPRPSDTEIANFARFSTGVAPMGTQTMIFGFEKSSVVDFPY